MDLAEFSMALQSEFDLADFDDEVRVRDQG